MTIRVYLNEKGVQNIVKGRRGAADTLCGYPVGVENGRKFLIVFGDLISPATLLAEPKAEYVDCVTYNVYYINGYRTDGMYRDGESEALLEMREDRDISSLPRQHIAIRAPNFAEALAMYQKIRDGKLKPTSSWHSLLSLQSRLRMAERAEIEDSEWVVENDKAEARKM